MSRQDGRQADVLPGDALGAVGGRLGRYAVADAASWSRRLSVLLALTPATMAVATLERSHCINRGWNGSDQFWHACFSDLPALYQLGNLSGGLPAYLDSGANGAHVDQPVLTGAVMSGVAGLVGGGSTFDQVRWYFILWALLATVLLMVTVFLTAASRPRHLEDAAQVALSPVLVFSALLSGDVVGVVLVAGAIYAWRQRALVSTGVLLGLAVMARTYPLLVLAALLFLALRVGRGRSVRTVVVAMAVTMAAVALPFLLLNRDALTAAYTSWWKAPASLGSPWLVPQLTGHALPVGAVNALTLLGIAFAVVMAGLLALSAPRRPTLAEVALVAVAIALVTGKSVPVQASLWLVPLVALCGLRWREHLAWAGAEALHFVAIWLYVAGNTNPDRAIRPGWYAVFLLVRVIGIGYLVWRVWTNAQQRLPRDADPDADWPDDPDRDEVVDELAGDFSERDDELIVRFG